MRWLSILMLSSIFLDGRLPADAQVKKEVQKITPGKVIVPTDAMRRPWGELLTMDLKTRTGTFRSLGNDEAMPFTVLPYAELLHHGAFGDLQDFRTGELAIFRLHQNDEGKWLWLTYIQDEMNFLNGHKEYYWVDRVDPAKREIEYTQANADKSFVRGKALILETDDQTRYWKNGQPAKFADIQIGDKLRAKSHGTSKGKHHRCWEVFLDDTSLDKFKKEQQQVHRKSLAEEGWPGYIDETGKGSVRLTLFLEGNELAKELKVGRTVRVAAAGGTDRKGGKTVEGTIREHRPVRNLHEVTIALKTDPPEPLVVTGVAQASVAAVRKQ